MKFTIILIKVVLAEQGKTSNWLLDQLEMNYTSISKWYGNEIQSRIETLFHTEKVLDMDVLGVLVSTKK